MTVRLSTRRSRPRARLKINWPLLIGVFSIGAVIYLGIAGPLLAPNDPLQENLIVQDATGTWHIPPFEAFSVEGFPLGSDEFGRDIFSRLLYGIRPTLQMVLIVASVRLVLGTVIGLIAGWSTGRLGRFFDTLISGALALPGLLVALGAIAVIGVELGVFAFIIGLSLTGWAESARIVREQTKMIRGQVFVEAAQALGSSDTQIVSRHVLRQIATMIWMLLAFEMGTTLMLTAGLGFLGYYIGGDVWVDVDDFVARRTSGEPELGQMLATAWTRLTEPWGLLAVGGVVFASVLGFNLVGEGLRLRISAEGRAGRVRWLSNLGFHTRLWFEHYLWHPVASIFQRYPWANALVWLAVLAGLAYGMVFGWQQGYFTLPEASVNLLFEDGATATPQATQVVVSGESDPDEGGSQVIDASAPEEDEDLEPALVWTYDAGAALIGDPLIDEDGVVYAASASQLIAIDPQGQLIWGLDLPARPVGSPTFAADGTIYLADKDGALNAVSSKGDLLWRYLTDPARAATSAPFVATDGHIYYALGGTTGFVQAVSAQGEGLWLAETQTFSFYNSPQADPQTGLVFLAEDVIDMATGQLLAVDFPTEVDRHVLGSDGRIYYRTGHSTKHWSLVDGQPVTEFVIDWNYSAYLDETTLPQETGVTESGVVWELYTTGQGGFTSVFWINQGEDGGEILGAAGAPISDGHLITMDEDSLTAVICGLGNFRWPNTDSPHPECHAVAPVPIGEEDLPSWMIQLEATDEVAGAAFSHGRLYVAGISGMLYAVDESPQPVGSDDSAEAGDPGTDAGITTTGSGWIFDVPANLLVSPIVHPDGRVYLLSEDQTFYVLNSDGSLLAELPLPEPIYFLENRGFGGTFLSFPFPPILTEAGHIVVATETRIFALDLEGTILWEIALEEPPFAAPAAGAGLFYVIDELGSLYAFSAEEGLVWRHDLADGLKAASPQPVFGPAGEIFYTITNGTVGFIEALSPEGEPLWRAELSTFKFFRPLQITPDGSWLALDDNVINTSTGRLVEAGDVEFSIDQYAMGHDGKTYLLSGSTVMEWEVGANGLRILNQVTVAFPEQPRGFPPALSVSSDGLIWIRIFSTGGKTSHLWVNPAGDVLAVLETFNRDDRLLQVSFANSILAMCSPDSELEQLNCRGYADGNRDPAWQFIIQGIGEADFVSYANGVLYVQVDGDTVQAVEVEIPGGG